MTEISYELKIGGQTAPPELLATIVTLEVEDHADIADMLRLRVGIAVQEDGRAWTLVDDGGFDRLARIQVAAKVGDGQAEPLIDAYVVDVRAVMSNEPGHSTLDVVAMDATVLMNLEEKVKAPGRTCPTPRSRSRSSATTASRPRWTTPSPRARRPTTPRSSAAPTCSFLRQLARRNGFECYVEADAERQQRGPLPRAAAGREPAGHADRATSAMETNVDSFPPATTCSADAGEGRRHRRIDAGLAAGRVRQLASRRARRRVHACRGPAAAWCCLSDTGLRRPASCSARCRRWSIARRGRSSPRASYTARLRLCSRRRSP